MDFKNIAVLGAISAIVAGYKQIQAALSGIVSTFIRTDSLELNNSPAEYITDILKDCKIIRWGNRAWSDFMAWESYISDYKGYVKTVFLKDKYIFALYNKRIPVILKRQPNGFSVTYIYRTFNFEKIIEKTFERLARERANEETTYQGYHWIYESKGVDFHAEYKSGHSSGTPAGNSLSGSPPTNTESLPFGPSDLKTNGKYLKFKWEELQEINVEKNSYFWSKESLLLETEVKNFIHHRSWFRERGIIHRRGVLITGLPGTGKTKMVLENAKKHNLPVRWMKIANMSDQEFVEAYKPLDTFSIVLIEDIDAVFNGRTNILAKQSLNKTLLSFDTLINTISGVKETDGILLIITTNNKEALDSALIRPGRIDRQIEAGNICLEGRQYIANNILRDWPHKIEEMVSKHKDVTVAEFENACIKVAIDLFYEKK